MPRVEFDRYAEMRKWMKYMQGKKREYIAFLTDDEELILQPTTSTAPITYGYAANIKETTAMTFVKDFKLMSLRVRRFEWKSENNLKKE